METPQPPLQDCGLLKAAKLYVARLTIGPDQSLAPAAPLACTRNQFSCPLASPVIVQLDFLPT
jgi:hypothetical protein